MEGFSEGDIARLLGQPLGTVNTRLVRVRKRLAVEAGGPAGGGDDAGEGDEGLGGGGVVL